MPDRKSILFVAPVEPWCRENGSSLITADLLDGLASLDDVEIFPVFVRRPPPGYQREAPDGLEGVLLDIPGMPRWRSVAKSVALWSSPLRHRFDNKRVADAILAAVRERGFEPDLVHTEHLPLVDIGMAVSGALGTPQVYRAHNVESRLWARRLGLPGLLRDPVVAHMDRLEADAVRSVDLTLCISEGDLEWARQSVPDARSELLPCTLRLERYDAIPRGAPVFERQVCFVGGLDWAPNEDGLRWFVSEVLPRIAAAVPNAGLAVLARGAAERDWLRDNPHVHILPAEAKAGELFASSAVSIAPLFQGGGVRIKIPESLAVDCPVVATEVGAEGHVLEGLTRTDDPQEFADACVQRLQATQDGGGRPSLRPDVEARYGATVQAKRLVGLWSETIAGRRRGERAAVR